MDEGGRLKGVAVALRAEIAARQGAQFGIDERNELVERLRCSFLKVDQQRGDIASSFGFFVDYSKSAMPTLRPQKTIGNGGMTKITSPNARDKGSGTRRHRLRAEYSRQIITATGGDNQNVANVDRRAGGALGRLRASADGGDYPTGP